MTGWAIFCFVLAGIISSVLAYRSGVRYGVNYATERLASLFSDVEKVEILKRFDAQARENKS